jgi:hypothetical protein
MTPDQIIRQQNAEAREAGRRSGAADRLLGVTNPYSAGSWIDPPNTYSYHYGRGYRDGQEGR